MTRAKASDKKLKEAQEALKRALADYHNLERRSKEEKEELLKFAAAQTLKKILPIVDDLEKAAHFVKDSGLRIIVESLNDFLKEEGVKEIESLGQKFDPQKMEAVEQVVGEDGVVVEVVRKGYEMNSRLLRPAQVKVGRSDNFGEEEKKVEKASQFGDYA